uniref:Uncharacterized protein n=1 Tax=Anguilla anguilla TaxID=7936 RepID=A0A0E9T9C4_ANGAN
MHNIQSNSPLVNCTGQLRTNSQLLYNDDLTLPELSNKPSPYSIHKSTSLGNDK